MRRIPLQSTSLASAGYDEETRVLEIEFRTGSVYRYHGVSPEVVDQFLHAPSRGRYFTAWIRDRYPTTRVR